MLSVWVQALDEHVQTVLAGHTCKHISSWRDTYTYTLWFKLHCIGVEGLLYGDDQTSLPVQVCAHQHMVWHMDL